MNKSDNIGNLAAALSKMQGEIQDVHKSCKGYGYSYADLSSILDITRPLCAKYELAVTQLCTNLGEQVGVETVLTHSSGEWISSALFMPVTAGKGMSLAQAAGSVITYARRYSLAALLGVAQTDNDASIREPILEKPSVTTTNYWPMLDALIEEHKLHDRIDAWCEFFKIEKLNQLSNEQMLKLIDNIKEKVNESI